VDSWSPHGSPHEIKLCCFKDHEFDTCADCSELNSCKIIQNWYSKKGYKHKRYEQVIAFIKNKGYPKFIRLANKWKNTYGKLD
jgi:hypothetical protein